VVVHCSRSPDGQIRATSPAQIAQNAGADGEHFGPGHARQSQFERKHSNIGFGENLRPLFTTLRRRDIGNAVRSQDLAKQLQTQSSVVYEQDRSGGDSLAVSFHYTAKSSRIEGCSNFYAARTWAQQTQRPKYGCQ
jgi:hypothetical protein